MPPNPRTDVDFSNNGIIDKEPPNNIDKDNKEGNSVTDLVLLVLRLLR